MPTPISLTVALQAARNGNRPQGNLDKKMPKSSIIKFTPLENLTANINRLYH